MLIDIPILECKLTFREALAEKQLVSKFTNVNWFIPPLLLDSVQATLLKWGASIASQR